MFPTLTNGDMCVVWLTDNIKRGNVVIVRYGSNDFVKRVIGLPNERIILTKQGIVIQKKNGKRILLAEPYLISYKPLCEKPHGIILGPKEYWVMGDNRQTSSDSRDFGPFKKEKLAGKVLLVLWRKL
jgi:signal peptidase I